MKFQSETGIVLMIVLIMLFLISVILMQGLELGLKAYKLSVSFEDFIKTHQKNEKNLKLQESIIVKDTAESDTFLKKYNTCFVPDHVGFAANTGVHVVQFREDSFQSRRAVRLRDPSFSSFVSPCLMKIKDFPSFFPKHWYLFKQAVNHSVLSVWDPKEGKVLSAFNLKENLQRVTVNESQAVYQNKLSTFVVISGEYAENLESNSGSVLDRRSKSRSYVFTLQNDTQALTLTSELIKAIPSELQKRSQAAFFCLSEKTPTWVLAIAGELKGEGVICFIFLTDPAPEKTRIIKTGSNAAVLHFQAVDRGTNQIATDLYLRDQSGMLFRINFENHSELSLMHQIWTVEKITRIRPRVSSLLTSGIRPNFGKVQHSLLAAEDPEGLGIILIMQGENEKSEPGVYGLRIYDPITEGKSLDFDSPWLIDTGNFASIHLRFGRLILIPETLFFKKEKIFSQPKVFDLAKRSLIKLSAEEALGSLPCLWKPAKKPLIEKIEVGASKNLDLDKVLYEPGSPLAFMFWDPLLKQEMLMILNEHCEFELYSSNLNEELYDRVSWQNLRN